MIVLRILFLLICVALTFIVLLQRGKVQGLSGAIAGGGDSFFGKNKSRTMQGGLHKVTVVLAVAFILIAILLNIFA